ncbi:MAG: NADP oxidoreductase [Actinobacteria bacterium RBG_13_35_12]|uniref:NADP oxidoreductase n=1 Tax=Candidatus Sediminicultor quintus TaxID=1797291 RepID=A0A1F5ABC4_9BACT|nr:MAG: NADP oxidoreductase [Actinobacteria bacterium RBG_13_35_12]OGD15829.1 MAG: NADP oxidoreductase [Candidatus Atribacteria bacterium RBG_19FT_COMBO_35_14]
MSKRSIAQVLVGIDGNTVLFGARKIKTKLITEMHKHGLSEQVQVIETGSIGPANQGVIIGVYPAGEMYGNITEEEVVEFVQERFVKGRPYKKLLLSEKLPAGIDLTAYDSRKTQYLGRIVLDNCGKINPEDIEEYIGMRGYEALGIILKEKTSEEVIKIVRDSGLKGRGGAGFPTGLKWSFTAKVKDTPKYVICNADEGEPGTFKDRLIMEGDPHKVLEGMAICGYAIGANTGYIYIRGEYQLSIQRLEKAIKDAEKLGLLGENIFGTDFDFQVKIKIGAGSYVCGEETALLTSMEGFRGEPRFKPPFPAESGFLAKPTNINNVETFANIAPIILNGAEWFKKLGTESSSGTKVYTVLGHIKRSGLIEVPMGVTLREIIYDYAGGMSSGNFKMTQIGGTAGNLLSSEFLDVPLDFQSLKEVGYSLGSGAVLIMNETVSVVDFIKCCMKFFVHESCGKCTPCREGTRYAYEILDKISLGKGKADDIESLKLLGESMKDSSFCPFGQSAPNSLLNSLSLFPEEYNNLLIK